MTAFDEAKHADKVLAVLTKQPCGAMMVRARLHSSYGLIADPSAVWRTLEGLKAEGKCEGDRGRSFWWIKG